VRSHRAALERTHADKAPSVQQRVVGVGLVRRRREHATASDCERQSERQRRNVQMLLAPAMKHIACSASEKDVRPAASRTIDVFRTIRAVATVRSISWNVTGCSFSSGVPSIATSALTVRSASASTPLGRTRE